MLLLEKIEENQGKNQRKLSQGSYIYHRTVITVFEPYTHTEAIVYTPYDILVLQVGAGEPEQIQADFTLTGYTADSANCIHNY